MLPQSAWGRRRFLQLVQESQEQLLSSSSLQVHRRHVHFTAYQLNQSQQRYRGGSGAGGGQAHPQQQQASGFEHLERRRAQTNSSGSRRPQQHSSSGRNDRGGATEPRWATSSALQGEEGPASSAQPTNPAAVREGRLKARFGPQAALSVREIPARSASPDTPNGDCSNPSSVPSTTSSSSSTSSLPASPPSASTSTTPRSTWRASVTFKQLGFPVEVGVAEADTREEAARVACEAALSTNVLFISPQLQPPAGHASASSPATGQLMETKRSIQELRRLCGRLGRVLKFSVKPKIFPSAKRNPPDHPEPGSTVDVSVASAVSPLSPSVASPMFACRAYARDDWSATAALSFLHESRGYSANDALVKCFLAIRDMYRTEVEGDAFVQEEYLEAVRWLHLHGKEVVCHVASSDGLTAESTVTASGNDVTPTTLQQDRQRVAAAERSADGDDSLTSHPEEYRAVAVVTDTNSGNTYTVRSPPQPTLADVYRAIAALLFDSEAKLHRTLVESAAYQPMLLKLRYQVEGMAAHVVEMRRTTAKSLSELVSVTVEEIAPTASLRMIEQQQQQQPQLGGGDAAAPPITVFSTKAIRFKAEGRIEGKAVARSEGFGAYRVEFDVYVQLLAAMLDRFPEIAQFHFAYCYPTTEMLERAAHHHDHYRLTNHSGKWTVYSVLGTITSTLLGGYYDKIVSDLGNCTDVKLIVNDGYCSSKVIAHRNGILSAKTNTGSTFRAAVTEAIKFNFPYQYEIASQSHPEFDVGSEHSITQRLRALPRHKRVAHLSHLFAIVGCFAEEDYGWRDLRVRTRCVAGDANRWIAELEAAVVGEQNRRRIVSVSPIALTQKSAKRLLVYNTCKQFFPTELEAYKKLGRLDASADHEAHDHDMPKVYRQGTPLFSQVLLLLDRAQPTLAPFSWRVERWGEPTSAPAPPSKDGAAAGSDSIGAANTQTAEAAGADVENMVNARDDLPTSDCSSASPPSTPRFKATLYGNGGEAIVAERIGNGGEGPLAVVRSVLRAATHTYASDTSNEGSELWREYDTLSPPALASTVDLCNFLFQLAVGGPGGGDGTSWDARDNVDIVRANANVTRCLLPSVDIRVVATDKQLWRGSVVLPNQSNLEIAWAYSTTKAGAHTAALVLACRQNFSQQLRHFSRNFVEAQAYADEVFHLPVVADDSAVALLRQEQQQRKGTEPNSLNAANSNKTMSSSSTDALAILQKCLLRHRGHRFVVRAVTERCSDGHGGSCGGEDVTCKIWLVPAMTNGEPLQVPPMPDQRLPHSISPSSTVEEERNRDAALVVPGNAEQLGVGKGSTPELATRAAALCALERHFPSELKAAAS